MEKEYRCRMERKEVLGLQVTQKKDRRDAKHPLNYKERRTEKNAAVGRRRNAESC